MRLLRPFIFLLAFVAALGISISAALAEKRVALVIGNGNYPKVGRLANPPNDAKLIASTLRQLGFDVIERVDANQKSMKKAIKAFGNKLSDAGKDAVGLFYYAGHGVQVGGTNYMIPVRADIEDEADVDIEAVSANAVQGNMAFAGNRLNIIIMDACRNNPFKRGFRSASRGLARMDASKGTLIAYATGPGDVAADGKGKNSPYTTALSKALLLPGLTVERAFKQVRNTVIAATNGKQVPWEASSLTGADFYFKPGTAKAVATPMQAPVRADIVAWQSIQNSTNPAEIEQFILAFRSSPFAGMARARLQALKEKAQQSQQVATVTTPKIVPSQKESSGRTGVYSGRRLTLKMQSSFGGGALQEWAKHFKDEVFRQSAGNLKIDLLSVNAVVRTTQIYNAVSKGVLDAAWTHGAYVYARHPAFGMLASSLFGPSTREFADWRLKTGDKLVNGLLGKVGLNVKSMTCAVFGAEGEFWSKRPVSSLKGLKIRTVGMFADILQNAGASVVQLPGGEIFPAMQSGLIDAANFSRPYFDQQMGLQDVAKYYYYPSPLNASQAFAFIINLNTWNNLPATDRRFLEGMCRQNIDHTIADDERRNRQALAKLRSRYGVKVLPVPDQIVRELRQGWERYAENFRRKYSSDGLILSAIRNIER